MQITQNTSMNKEAIYDIFYAQLAKDYSCSIEEIKNHENIITVNTYPEGRRQFKPETFLAKIITLNGKFVLCVDECLREQAESLKELKGEWMSLGQQIRKLNELTAEYGYTVMDQHHYYLPTGTPALSNEAIEQMKQQYTLTWFEGSELEQFRGDKRFSFALSFSETAPDMLAVTAEKDGMILGMSGASADSDSMWQIGIDVAKEARGQNIGPFLTILLKEEIIRRGKLPFYGTAESHIQSQRVGLKSGFFPAWWEAYSYRNAE